MIPPEPIGQRGTLNHVHRTVTRPMTDHVELIRCQSNVYTLPQAAMWSRNIIPLGVPALETRDTNQDHHPASQEAGLRANRFAKPWRGQVTYLQFCSVMSRFEAD